MRDQEQSEYVRQIDREMCFLPSVMRKIYIFVWWLWFKCL